MNNLYFEGKITLKENDPNLEGISSVGIGNAPY